LIIFDEKKYALDMLQNGFKNERDTFHDLMILSKYLYHIGKDRTQVKSDIFEFCTVNICDFNKYLFAKDINRIVAQASNSKLRTDSKVDIYDSDIQTLETLDDEKQKRVFFVLLVLYRLYGKPFEIGLNELFKMANTNLNSKSKYEILNLFHKKGLIDVSVDMRYKVLVEEPSGELALSITDFDNMILYYMELKGFNVKHCASCDLLFCARGNKQKYCLTCSRLMKNGASSN
jgi:hypothetical protein